MFNKSIMALCLLTLLGVFADVALLHSPVIHAQNTKIRVEEIHLDRGSGLSQMAGGTIVGFSCTETSDTPRCFVASR